MLRIVDTDEDIVSLITDECGYKFDFIGNINMQYINEFCNTLIMRLTMENIVSSDAIDNILIVPDKVKIKRDKPLKVGKVVSISDYFETINVFSIYVIFDEDKILDDFSFNNTMPLILDCELIDELFDAYGEYIGSNKDIKDYTKIYR